MTDESPKKTAVVAEDDFLVSREVVRAAQAAGLSVVGVAADGVEAVAMVKRLSPSVALLDIQMPRLTGLQVAQCLRDEHPTPVVILTAFESAEILAEAADAGVGAYVTKPPDAPGLARAVAIAIARHADLVELKRLNSQLQQALSEVRTLRSLLPICMTCKKIRDEEGLWHRVEAYISTHTDTTFSHGLCPDCYRDTLETLEPF